MNCVNNQRKPWVQEDNAMLNEAVKKFGFKWQLVANYIKNRTPNQCAQRWKRIKKKMSAQKSYNGVWTKEEISKLKVYIKEYGKNWKLISEMIQTKTGRQVRDKYINNLDPKIKSQPWTQEEDDILYENFLLHGSKWTLIKRNLPQRSERMVKNRFYNHIRYTHLKLQNPYKLMNNQVNAQDEIKMHRQQIIGSSNITSKEPFQENEDFQSDDLSKFLNLYTDTPSHDSEDI